MPSLADPLSIGTTTLSHRIVMAPLTRYRANSAHVHGDLAVEYYSQRASVPGTMIITEATYVSPRGTGEANAPGVWNTDQIAAWKRVTEAVHQKKSFIWCQLWGMFLNPFFSVILKSILVTISLSCLRGIISLVLNDCWISSEPPSVCMLRHEWCHTRL